VLMHWCAEAARRGAIRAVASHPMLDGSRVADSDSSEAAATSTSTSTAARNGAAEMLQGCGFTPVGRSMLRDLLIYSGE
jgi:hypothetical protein